MTMTKFLAALCVLSLAAGSMLARADDPPSDLAAKVAAEAKAFAEAVKRDSKVVAKTAKEGSHEVAESAKEIAHDVATASKQGAKEVAAAAKRGADKTKAVVKSCKSDKADKPHDGSGDKPQR
jgi:hypothetical protein